MCCPSSSLFCWGGFAEFGLDRFVKHHRCRPLPQIQIKLVGLAVPGVAQQGTDVVETSGPAVQQGRGDAAQKVNVDDQARHRVNAIDDEPAHPAFLLVGIARLRGKQPAAPWLIRQIRAVVGDEQLDRLNLVRLGASRTAAHRI